MSNVPKLRFKEFSGEWKLKKLEQLSSKISDGIHSTPEYNQDGDYYFINGNNLKNGKIILDENTKKVTEKEYLKHYRELSNQTILMSINGTIGNIAFYNNENIMLGKSACYININNNLTNKFFISNQLSSSKIQYYYTSELTGSTIKNLSLKTIKNTPIGLPSIQEQEKIASFLTSVDTKIEQLTKKETLLQQYKKGVMKKIFNQEIRFKADDGSEFYDWEEKSVGQCIIHIGGTALEKYVSDKAEYNFISIGNYSTTGKYIDNGQRVILNEKTKTKLLEKDDLVMVLNDKTSSGDIIGSTIYIDKNDKYIYNQRSERIICKDGILPLYFWHYFNSQLFRKKVFSLAQGGTQIYINFSSIKSIETSIPCFEEQIKIANFLSSIDSKIEQVQKQLNSTKEFKKALLQQMFI